MMRCFVCIFDLIPCITCHRFIFNYYDVNGTIKTLYTKKKKKKKKGVLAFLTKVRIIAVNAMG